MRPWGAALAYVVVASAASPVLVEQAALLETPMMRADTLLSTADLVTDKATRVRLVQEALQAMRSVRNEEARGFYWAGAADLLASVDFDEALRLAREAPVRQAAAWRADYRGRAFNFLIKRKPEMVEEALRSGAFHVPAAIGHENLFPMLLANFPKEKARLDDVELLLAASEKVAPSLMVEAVTAALLAKGTPEDFEEAWIGDVKLEGGMKTAIRIRIAQHVRKFLPDLWTRWDFSDLAEMPEGRPEIEIWRVEEGDLEERLLEKGPVGEYLDAVMRKSCVTVDFTQHRECAAAAHRAAEVFAAQGIRPDDIGLRNASLRARWLLQEMK